MGEYGTSPTSTSRRASSRSSTRAAPTRCRSRSCPGSLYHCSKVHDSTNIHFACRIWGLRATDLNQGVVYGDRDRGDRPRRAADHPLRLRRDLRHRAQPLLRAGGDRPPADRLRLGRPDPRASSTSATPCAASSSRSRTRPIAASSASSTSSPSSSRSASWRSWSRPPAEHLGYTVEVQHVENPRVELEEHYYNAIHTKLLDLGLEPTLLGEELVESMIARDRAPQGAG